MHRSHVVGWIAVVALGLALLLASGASATAPMPPPQLRGNSWAQNADQVASEPRGRFSFGCPAPGDASDIGALWGTDVYYYSSSVCTAAVHAGFITLVQGGTVVIETQRAGEALLYQGNTVFQGSTRNGVTSATLTLNGDGSDGPAFRVVSGAARTTTTTTRATTTTTRRTTTTRPTTTTTRPTRHAVTLTASATTATVGSAVMLTALSAIDVGPLPYYILIYDNGVAAKACGTGTTCAYSALPTQAGTHSFTARIARGDATDTQAQSSTVNVTWTAARSSTTTTRPRATTTTTRPRATTTTRPTTTTTRRTTTTTTPPTGQSVTLSASATAVPIGTLVTLTARSVIDVGPTPWYIVIFDNGLRVNSCSSGTTCVYRAAMGIAGTHSFFARIARSDGTESQAQSSTVFVTWTATNTGTPPPDDGQPPPFDDGFNQF